VKTPTVKLGEICEINPATDYDFDPQDACSFVPMEAVDDVDARITRMATRPFREVAKGYTPFAENDVIVAKITPCMENGKCAIGRRLRSGVAFGSTEFHVLRATKRVIPEWLFYFWRFPPTRKLASVNMTGSAGQKRVPASFLETADIPLPDLSEQQRMAERLELADRLCRTRRYALELTDTFLPAAFLEFFGDPSRNEMNWDLVPWGEIVTVSSGKGFKLSEYSSNGVRLLQIANVTFREIDWTVTAFLPDTYLENYPRLALRPGDLVMALNRPILGRKIKFAVLEEDDCPSILYQRVGKLTLNGESVIQPFLCGFMLTDYFFQELKKRLTGSDQPYINPPELDSVRVPTPPLPLQHKFAALVERVERLRAVQREALRQAEHLFASLLHHAFSG
jgi:type I restriction enzyme, S subunit